MRYWGPHSVGLEMEALRVVRNQEDPFIQPHLRRASCVQARAGCLHPIALLLLLQ